MGERRLHGTARSILKDKQHVQFHRSARHLPAGWAATWDRPRRFVQNFCWWRERKQFFFHFSSSGPRLFESRQQRGTTARSRVVVSVNGGLFEREPAGRGCGIFLGAAEGIRLSPHGSSKSVLSERHWIVACAARILRLVAEPGRLRQRHDLHVATSQTANRRAGFRRELDCGYRSCPTSPPVSSKEGSRGRAGLVPGKRRQSASCRMVAGDLLSPGKARGRGGRPDQGARLPSEERLQGL